MLLGLQVSPLTVRTEPAPVPPQAQATTRSKMQKSPISKAVIQFESRKTCAEGETSAALFFLLQPGIFRPLRLVSNIRTYHIKGLQPYGKLTISHTWHPPRWYRARRRWLTYRSRRAVAA